MNNIGMNHSRLDQTAIKKRFTLDHESLDKLREEDIDDATTKVTM